MQKGCGNSVGELPPTTNKDDILYHRGFSCRKDVAIPWRAIFTSLPVWGIVLGHAASNWGNYTLNQQLPTYLTDVLRFDLSYTGLLSSMCYVLQWIGRNSQDGI